MVAEQDGVWTVRGFGVGGGQEPADMLDLGNSGTAARLLTGILASHRFTSFMTGDASLRSRPMQRVIDPLSRMGARFEARDIVVPGDPSSAAFAVVAAAVKPGSDVLVENV